MEPLEKIFQEGVACLVAGRYQQGRHLFEKALAICKEPKVVTNLAVCYRRLGLLQQAEQLLEEAAQNGAMDGNAWANLANIKADLGDHAAALQAAEQSLALQPTLMSAHAARIRALNALQRFPEAQQAYHGARMHGDSGELRNEAGCTWYGMGQYEAAQGLFESALQMGRSTWRVHQNLATVYERLGLLEQAVQQFDQAIALNPENPTLYYRRVFIDDQVGAGFSGDLERLTAQADSLSLDKQADLFYACGKVYQRRHCYEEAFAAFSRGAAAMRSLRPYDEQAVLGALGQVPCYYRLLQYPEPRPEQEIIPVFIVGMPRSGTTLVEQILASHPMVAAAGEVQYLPAALKKAGHGVESLITRGMPDDLRISAQVADHYLTQLAQHRTAGKCTYVTDKLPGNYADLGSIYALFRHKIIIHCRRDPIDTCLSNYLTPFEEGQPWTNELGELGRYYRHYYDLMAFWNSVLPAGSIYELQYEDLVHDQERETRRLLAHCGLPWDECCLRFEETARPVTTASVSQVRKPMYGTSVRRWEPYRKQLAPLLAELEHVIGQEASALHRKGLQARSEGNLTKAIRCLQQAVALHASPEYLNNLGGCLVLAGEHEQACQIFRQAVAQAPAYADPYANLAHLAAESGTYQEALHLADMALERQAAHLNALLIKARVLNHLGRFDTALIVADDALARMPGCAEAWLQKGLACAGLQCDDDARAAFKEVLALEPDHTLALMNIGYCMRRAGELDEAITQFDHAIKVAPDNIYSYYARAVTRKIRVNEPFCTSLQGLVPRLPELPCKDQVYLWYALGKFYQDTGAYDRAFSCFSKGADLHFPGFSYSIQPLSDRVASLKELFGMGYFEALQQASGSGSDVPIFIIGMPRSGTTLVEQILASHPQVAAAGELKALEYALTGLQIPGDPPLVVNGDFVDAKDLITPLEAAQRYLHEVEGYLKTGQRFVTDKMPENFFSVGFIYGILPRARIIHVRRHPLDTCVSNFTTLFAQGHPWSYNLTELGRYYCLYADIMQYWRTLLPPGSFLEVDYEQLVTDQESQTRRLLEYCGLPWDDRCMRFHVTRRTVATASAAQVRLPLHAASVQRWKHYADQLAPLISSLGAFAE